MSSMQTESAYQGEPNAAQSKGREPRARADSIMKGDGSIGDQAFIDGVIIVIVAWLVLFFLAYSLRKHIV